jgi:hypothetical protein
MNPNQPIPKPPPHGNSTEMNDAILKKISSHNWKGRALTIVALAVGIVSIAAGALLTWANSHVIFPQIQLLLKEEDSALHQNLSLNAPTATPTNSVNPQFTLSDGTTVDRQVLVTLMLGKAMNVTSLALALVAVGTLLTLLLVIFNRRVTLRQISASLAQISNQIKELQGGRSSEAKQ